MNTWLSKILGKVQKPPPAAAAKQVSPKPASMPLPGNATVTRCPKCGKQLRLVFADKPAQIRCPFCKNEFSYVKYCPFQGCGWPATKGDHCDRHSSKEVRDRLNAEDERLAAEGEARAKIRLDNETEPPGNALQNVRHSEIHSVVRKDNMKWLKRIFGKHNSANISNVELDHMIVNGGIVHGDSGVIAALLSAISQNQPRRVE